MRICVCPGSYDPVTNGHLDITRRGLLLFDRVILAVMVNPAKQGAFPPSERVVMVRDAVRELFEPAQVERITVDSFSDALLVHVCEQVGATAILKGLRGGTDFAYELPMARMNFELTGVETVFLPADPRLEHISSSLVKEVARCGADVSAMVPPGVLAKLQRSASRA